MAKTYSRLVWWSTALLSVLLILMPFHAFFVTVAGHIFEYKGAISAWKEVVIIILSISALLYWLKHRAVIKLDTVNSLALGIVGLSLLVSIANLAYHTSFLVGLKTNIFPLFLFAIAQVFSESFTDKKLRYLLFIPAILVTILAILQPYLFHPSLLLKIGYGPEGASGTILAGQYIESAATTVRAFSTLGGPNQLGTYLLIPALAAVSFFIFQKKWQYLVLAILFSVGVYITYSRSALIGLVFGIAVLVALKLPAKLRLATFVGLALILGGLFFLLLSPNQCNYVDALPKSLIHGSCESGLLSGSDKQRVESQHNGVVAIAKQPFGYGLGSAGPASFYNTKPLITENWYLQIAVEIGVLGLLLYLAFFVLLGKEFYQIRSRKSTDHIWPSAGLAIIIAIGVASMFLHAPADSTLSIIGFSLFGIIKGRNT